MKKGSKTIRTLYSEHTGKVSDKWTRYLVEYDLLFGELRDKPVRMLEIGVQNGGGLEIWANYFGKGEKFIGCDINPDCGALHFDDPRIAMVVGDANTDIAQEEILSHSQALDIVIDDGSHLSGDVVRSFLRYFPNLEDGGIYVVEDMHTSYWDEYDGGLFAPFSSITFFKRLVDIINFEHWGVARPPSDILAGFREKYGVEVKEEILQHIHSIKFVNSLCIILKSQPADNKLGTRFLAGKFAAVDSDVMQLQGGSLVPPEQNSNPWSANIRPPYEELSALEEILQVLTVQAAEKEREVQALAAQVVENEQFVQALSTQITEREQSVQALSGQLAEKEHFVQALAALVAEKEQSVQALSGQVAEKEQSVQALSGQVAEIRGSTAWSIVQYLWKARVFMAPHGSKRERFGRLIMNGFRIWRVEGFKSFFQKTYLKINNSENTRQKNPLHNAQRIITPLAEQTTLSIDSDLQQRLNAQYNSNMPYIPKRYGADQFLLDKKVKHFDTGVIYHLYYPELWDHILPYLSNLDKEFDLFITIPYNVSISEQHIRKNYPDAQIYRCENRGRDVAPFLTVFSAISMFGYKYICKIHTKKSPHLKAGIQWRDDMLGKLLGSQKTIGQIKTAFDQNPSLGLIAPKGHVAPYNYYWSRNESNVIKLAHCIGLPTEQFTFSFVAGSMFWFRPDVFSPLTKMGIFTEDFDSEQGQDDGTLAHAFERFFGMVVCETGYQIAECDSSGIKPTTITPDQADSFTHAYAASSGLVPKD